MPNWYTIHLKASFTKIANEYWIDESGNATFADGDAGVDVQNHEQQVVEAILGKYGLSSEETGSFAGGIDSEFIQHFAANNLDKCVAFLKANNWLPESYDEMAVENPKAATSLVGYNLTLESILQILGATPEEAACGAGKGDARDFALKNWGWKRVGDGRVETWDLTPQSLKIMGDGLGNIAFEDGHDFDSEEEPKYNIYVASTRAYYRDVPLSVLDSGDVAGVARNTMVNKKNQIVAPIVDNHKPVYNPYRPSAGDGD